MKIRDARKELFFWALALVNPFLGFFGGLFLSFSRVRVSYFALSFSIALMYMYFPLLWDVKNNFYRIIFRPEDGLNFYTYAIQFFVVFFGFSFIGAVFLVSVLMMFVLAVLFGRHLDDIRSGKSYSYYLVSLLLYLSLFEYRQCIDLVGMT